MLISIIKEIFTIVIITEDICFNLGSIISKEVKSDIGVIKAVIIATAIKDIDYCSFAATTIWNCYTTINRDLV